MTTFTKIFEDMYKLRWYQELAVKSILEYKGYKKGKHPLLAIPTGAGKSLIIAAIVQRTLKRWPDQRILMLTHQRELVEQNEQELLTLWPEAPVGVFAAGLKRKEFRPIVFASIQSVYRYAELFDHYKLIIVDEAHLIPYKESSMYRKFFAIVKKPIIGLTATPFRLGSGLLTDGEDALFHDIVLDLSQREGFTRLVDEGYLCNLVAKQTITQIDVTEARVRAGEFMPEDLKKATDVEEITNAALNEVVKQGEDRKHWLIFAIDIEHAENIGKRLTELGISNVMIHSKMEEDRGESIERFRSGDVRAAVSVGMMTTGVNVKTIDLIVLLRPTASPVLHVQMIGRGLRVAEEKKNCLVMDFAQNVSRLGPINDVHLRKIRKGDNGGKPITKTCPECMSIIHAAAKLCPDCGHEFEFKTKLQSNASEETIVHRVELKPPVWYPVHKVMYYRHIKINKPDSLRVVYRSGMRSFTEWVCFEHQGQARYKAEFWWRRRTRHNPSPVPDNVTEALLLISQLQVPTEIQVNESHRYPTITSYRFNPSLIGKDKRATIGSNPIIPV